MMRIITLLMVAAGTLLFSGCAACTDCGTIRENHAITRIFYDQEIVPGYNYFYHGEILDPDTILGVHNSYTLQGKFWTPIELSQEQLTKWVVDIERRPYDADSVARYQGRYQGAEILDPQGKRVGIWYSKYDWGLFKFPGNQVIIAYPPSLKPGSGGFLFNVPRSDDR